MYWYVLLGIVQCAWVMFCQARTNNATQYHRRCMAPPRSPSSARFICRLRSYSARSFPSSPFRYKYSLRSRWFLRSILFAYSSRRGMPELAP